MLPPKKLIETFWEISQLKEEVRDLKTLVKALISKLKNGGDDVSDVHKDITLDSYLHKLNIEHANQAIDNLGEVQDDKADEDKTLQGEEISNTNETKK